MVLVQWSNKVELKKNVVVNIYFYRSMKEHNGQVLLVEIEKLDKIDILFLNRMQVPLKTDVIISWDWIL